MNLELVVQAGTQRVPVAVAAEATATVTDLLAALSEIGLPGVSPVLDQRVRLRPDQPLVAAGLRAGATLGGQLTRPPVAETGCAEVATVGGLCGGLSTPLPCGSTVTVGRAPDSRLVLADNEVSREHLAVHGELGGRWAVVTDLGSANGTRLGQWRLAEPAWLDVTGPGQVFGLGESVLAVGRPDRRPAEIAAGPEGTCLVNRPPRIVAPPRLAELVVPVPPESPKGFRFPWLATLAPALICGGLYLVLPAGGYGMYLLLMMAMSPVLALVNLISDRRSGRREYRLGLAVYAEAQSRSQAAMAEAAAADEVAERQAHPNPSELVARVMAPSATLWQRRRSDPDFLALRVGLRDRPARLVLRHATASDHPLPEPPVVRDVPAIVEVSTAGVLGVAAPRDTALAAARALLLQAAALHSPADLGIVLLTGRHTAGDWDWLTWLPHTLPASSTVDCARLVATDTTQAEARLAELRGLIDERTAERRLALADGTAAGRAVLIVLDGARRLRDLAGLAAVLAGGPAAGIYAVCLDTDETALPNECEATVVATSPTRATVNRRGMTPVDDVLLDGLVVAAAEQAARAMAPLRPLGAPAADSALPDRVRLRDLVGVVPVQQRWRQSPHGRSTRAVLGVGETGPLEVDLRRDGPHVLIAGTSGAGKSELLQTLVTSLALANMPDALTFVLVDYKGGSAFADCAELPHCVGMITDLDGHLVRRALNSLSAELRRREALFAEARATDIEDYWARTGARLPRLVIVVDEFASLVEELPEFVTGVVGIGMRGRSLGVHIILATQRPGGVVSADLRANLNLRISLRVTSDTDSIDVIDAPDAARISHRRPGRAFLRTGHGLLTEFQAARASWPLATAVYSGPPVRVTARSIQSLGQSRPVAPNAEQSGPTDLTELVAMVKQASAGMPAVSRPWLDPLPPVVSLSALDRPGGGPVAAVLGLVDRPAAQAQEPFVLDLEHAGCTAIAGAVRTGRSTALRTLAASLASEASPGDVHLYVLDCGNQALAALAALPHCGAVVDGNDRTRTERLLALLHGEVGRRQRQLTTTGCSSLGEHRAATAETGRLPYLVLLVDRLEGFLSRYAEVDSGRLVEQLEALLRTGPAVGVSVVLSCDRTGFPHRIASAVAARLVLRQASTDDAAAFGLDPRAVPGQWPAGRGIWLDSGDEVQVALIDPDPAGAAQAAAVERLGAALAVRWDGTPEHQLPRRVDRLPEEIDSLAAEELRRLSKPPGPAICTPAVGGDRLGPVDIDLADLGGSFVVVGPQRSGRSTALHAIATSLAGRPDSQLPVVIVTPRRSPLRELVNISGIAAVLDGDPGELPLRIAAAASAGPVALVVDDGELLVDHHLVEALDHFTRAARDSGSLLVAAATTEDLTANPYRGWLAAARRPRSGLLLNPTSYVDGEIFGVRLPRSTNGGWPPGRGLLIQRGEISPVQVVLPVAMAATQ